MMDRSVKGENRRVGEEKKEKKKREKKKKGRKMHWLANEATREEASTNYEV